MRLFHEKKYSFLLILLQLLWQFYQNQSSWSYWKKNVLWEFFSWKYVMNSSILVKTHRQKTKTSPSELISNHFEVASNDILELQLSCSFQNSEIWKVVKRKFPYFGRWQRWTVPVFSHPKPWWKLICLQDKNDICERLRDKHCFIFRYKQFWI